MVSSKIFAQLLFSSVALAGSLDLRQAGTKVSRRRKRKKNTNIHPYPQNLNKRKNTPTNIFLFFFSPTKQQCDSDDACKTPCRTPNIQAQGVNVTPSEKIQEEARRRFGDAHCENKRCACAVSGSWKEGGEEGEGEIWWMCDWLFSLQLTSDDQAQDFCKFWVSFFFSFFFEISFLLFIVYYYEEVAFADVM